MSIAPTPRSFNSTMSYGYPTSRDLPLTCNSTRQRINMLLRSLRAAACGYALANLAGCAAFNELLSPHTAVPTAAAVDYGPAIQAAQQKVETEIMQELGGSNPELYFRDDAAARTEDGQVLVEGTGVFLRNAPGPDANIAYTANVAPDAATVTTVKYRILEPGEGEDRRIAAARAAVVKRVQDKYGADVQVSFLGAQSYFISPSRTGIRGAGLAEMPDGHRLKFGYHVVLINRSKKATQIQLRDFPTNSSPDHTTKAKKAKKTKRAPVIPNSS